MPSRKAAAPATLPTTPAEATGIANLARYRARSLPAVGALLKAEDSDEKQISLMD